MGEPLLLVCAAMVPVVMTGYQHFRPPSHFHVPATFLTAPPATPSFQLPHAPVARSKR